MSNKRKIIWIIGGVVIFALIGYNFWQIREIKFQIISLQKQIEGLECCKKDKTAFISRVVDGDSVELKDGTEVRLLGINAAERGQLCYQEAANKLKELIEGKNVILEKDVEDKDQYGRLLRFVFLENENINVKMVKEGLAKVYVLEPNVKYESELREAWEKCKEQKKGCLCQFAPDRVCDNRCLGIQYFQWNAEGNDCENLNDEYVTFVNNCSWPCDLTSWTVEDEGRHTYKFPKFNLENGKTVTLYTGCGTNSTKDLYWCSQGFDCNAIWNNSCSGDTLYLRNAEGDLILDYHYTGFCE